MTRWTPDTRNRAYQAYCEHGSLRKAHHVLTDELRRTGAKTAPAWNTFRSWAKSGNWEERRAKVQAKAEAKTDEALADWRLRRVAQLDKGLDFILRDETGKTLAALIAKNPSLITKIIEVADRLRGGGEKHSVDVTAAELVIRLKTGDDEATNG